jgi:phage terminase large subunit GpA-like protein
MVWDRPDGEVWCQCPACGERLPQYHKATMLAGAEWRASAAGDGQTAGFHLPGWYAPAGWTPWEQIRDEFLRAKTDPLLLKGWVNKRAAEAWEDESVARVSADGLMTRAAADPYPSGYCPAGVLLLVAAVDVQDTWLEVSVWGFGRGEESWLIWHQRVDGSPAEPNPWSQIDSVRRLEWPREGGGSMTIRAVGVDTGGHFTQEAYAFCRARAREGVVALKGSSTRAAPALGRGSKQDVNWRGNFVKGGVVLYMVGTDTIKRSIYARLQIQQPGPGFVHFGQNATDEYLEGLTCERLIPRMVKGFQILEWQKPANARNEPLDTAVYCVAMLELVKRRYNRATMWDQLAAQLTAEPPDRASRRRATTAAPRDGGFVGGW